MSIRIGTSGWHYKHWLDDFYPAKTAPSAWFALYARRFDTVELNNPFYRLPSAETFANWAKAAPPGFLFAVKASRYITHQKRLKDAGEAFSLFFEHARHLGTKLGPILFQLPPSFKYNLGRLDGFLSGLPPGRGYVMEFRNEDWLRDEVFEAFERHGVAFCIHDMRGMRMPDKVTSNLVYVRFHGSDARYGGNYPDAHLEQWAEKIRAWSENGHRVFCYFNNDTGGWAPKNARTLIRLLEEVAVTLS